MHKPAKGRLAQVLTDVEQSFSCRLMFSRLSKGWLPRNWLDLGLSIPPKQLWRRHTTRPPGDDDDARPSCMSCVHYPESPIISRLRTAPRTRRQGGGGKPALAKSAPRRLSPCICTEIPKFKVFRWLVCYRSSEEEVGVSRSCSHLMGHLCHCTCPHQNPQMPLYYIHNWRATH